MRAYRIVVTVNAGEHQMIADRARRAGKPVATYVREVALAVVTKLNAKDGVTGL